MKQQTWDSSPGGTAQADQANPLTERQRATASNGAPAGSAELQRCSAGILMHCSHYITRVTEQVQANSPIAWRSGAGQLSITMLRLVRQSCNDDRIGIRMQGNHEIA